MSTRVRGFRYQISISLFSLALPALHASAQSSPEYSASQVPAPPGAASPSYYTKSATLGAAGEIGMIYSEEVVASTRALFAGAYYLGTWHPLDSGLTTGYHFEADYNIGQFFSDHSAFLWKLGFAFGRNTSSGHKFVTLNGQSTELDFSAVDSFLKRKKFRLAEADSSKRILLSGVAKVNGIQSSRRRVLGKVGSVLIEGTNIVRLPFAFHGNTIADGGLVGGFQHRLVDNRAVPQPCIYNIETDSLNCLTARLPKALRRSASQIISLDSSGNAVIEVTRKRGSTLSLLYFYVTADTVTAIQSSDSDSTLEMVGGRCGIGSNGKAIGNSSNGGVIFDPVNGLRELIPLATIPGGIPAPGAATCINAGGSILYDNLVLFSPIS